uniref:ABC transporter G family member 20 n=1 Tax=Cacopsylla melanoneura TaxID=428564 RepID=A0A8D8XHD1_9HEMI
MEVKSAGNVKAAVLMRGAYKKYGKGPNILKNFSMTIPKNKIYGLLGSSGCGKTTLLKCLVGALDLDYGDIDLIVTSRKQIGFMPQETALFEEFTIAETFQFYAKLYRISGEQFRAKMKEMQAVLDLPPDHRTCSTLSGGQVRRVSIAVTLLHTPSLVILDEPTSGLDPMLAHQFWQYLQRMSVAGQTIIITTHYIEEARQADIVGLMRKGSLLAEDPPEKLMTQYNVDSLEDVFLRLCHKQNESEEKEPDYKIPFQDPYRHEKNSLAMFWPHTKAIIFKNMKWVQRNFIMFMLLSFVLCVACIFESNECLKNTPPMRLGVVNHGLNRNCSAQYLLDTPTYLLDTKRSLFDTSTSLFDTSNTILDPSSSLFDTSTSLDGVDTTQTALFNTPTSLDGVDTSSRCGVNDTVDFSCHFVDMWKSQVRDISVHVYDDMSQAMAQAKSRYLVSVIEFPFNFTRGVLTRFQDGMSADENLLKTASADIRLDSTDFMAVYMIEQNIRDVLGKVFQNYLTSCNYSAKVAELPPMNINKEEFLGEGVVLEPHDYTTHVALSCMVGLSYLCPIILLTMSLCLEKVTGAYTRCIISGVRFVEILAAYTLVIMLFTFFNVIAMGFVQFVIYGKPYGNLWLTGLLLNMIGLTGTFFGFVVVIVTRTLVESAGLCIITSVSCYTFTGFIYPIEAAMFPQVRYISTAVLPNTLALKSLFAIVWKNASIFNKQVYLGFFICAAHSLFYAGVIYWLLRYKKSL